MGRDVMDALVKRQANVDAVLQQVARVLNHRSFARSRSPARLLRALGERMLLAGRVPATQLDLARVLGLPANFDPARNPLVRIHMSKLRRMLARYAEGDGRNDPVMLVIPRNAYRLEGVISGAEQPRAGTAGDRHPVTRAADRAIVLVSEFVGADQSLDALTRSMAMWLMSHLLDLDGIAAIGPLLRQWDAGGAMRALLVRRSRCAFILEGDCRAGGRGIQIVARVVDVNDGRVCWTDWIDEPAAAGPDDDESTAKVIAARISNRIGSDWMPAARPANFSEEHVEPSRLPAKAAV